MNFVVETVVSCNEDFIKYQCTRVINHVSFQTSRTVSSHGSLDMMQYDAE